MRAGTILNLHAYGTTNVSRDYQLSAKIPSMANLNAILTELQQERDQLDQAIAALTSLNHGTSPHPSRGRTMSAAARRRISAAQKARWAKVKTKSTPGSARPKRHISAAGIARIRAAAKARWARVKAAKKK
jgi:hypothetical protein